MIKEIRIKNCFSFSEPMTFSLKADMRSKRFPTNIINVAEQNLLKVVGIYGPNNSGKTCLIRCVNSLKHILLGEDPRLTPNLFTKNTICELGITFVVDGKVYSYDFKYNVKTKEYIYEEFCELHTDKYGNEKSNIWLLRDTVNKKYDCQNKNLQEVLAIISTSNLVCYLIDASKFDCLNKIKNIISKFANKIDIINMNNIPLKKTIELFKNKNNLQEKVVEFIKNADMYLEDYKYVDAEELTIVPTEKEHPSEKVLDIPEGFMDRIRLTSVYKGIPVPSILFDSTGTKKIAALASYIIEGLEEGRMLFVDELDNSIHFKLTRAIVSMFNNELNNNTQLIFTVHDINLMDCKKMFRKEQIWFVHKDIERVYLYSLADFTSEQGIRETSDIIEKYRKGVLGALPEPELIESLLSIKRNSELKEDSENE